MQKDIIEILSARLAEKANPTPTAVAEIGMEEELSLVHEVVTGQEPSLPKRAEAVALACALTLVYTPWPVQVGVFIFGVGVTVVFAKFGYPRVTWLKFGPQGI